MSIEPIFSRSSPDPGDLIAKLGMSLVDSGTIDRRTLDRARRVAVETGSRLDQVLTQLGLISDRGLAEALAHLIAAPLVGAADYPEAPLFQDRLKSKFLRRVRAVPIAANDDRATLAMADPLDLFQQCCRGGARSARRGGGRGADRARSRPRPSLRRSLRRRRRHRDAR